MKFIVIRDQKIVALEGFTSPTDVTSSVMRPFEPGQEKLPTILGTKEKPEGEPQVRLLGTDGRTEDTTCTENINVKISKYIKVSMKTVVSYEFLTTVVDNEFNMPALFKNGLKNYFLFHWM